MAHHVLSLPVYIRSIPAHLPAYRPPQSAPPTDDSPSLSESMGKFAGVFKTVFIPASISLVLYLIVHYILLPAIRRHRYRYSQHLPLQFISDRTTSASLRVIHALNALDWRPRWANNLPVWRGYRDHTYNDEELLDDDLGEGMVGFDMDTTQREDVQSRATYGVDTERRLSRELEEGFRDESDEENKDDYSRLRQDARPATHGLPRDRS